MITPDGMEAHPPPRPKSTSSGSGFWYGLGRLKNMPRSPTRMMTVRIAMQRNSTHPAPPDLRPPALANASASSLVVLVLGLAVLAPREGLVDELAEVFAVALTGGACVAAPLLLVAFAGRAMLTMALGSQKSQRSFPDPWPLGQGEPG